MLKLAIDAMGGDHSPEQPINGIKSYLEDHSNENIFFYILGDEKKISTLLKKNSITEKYKIIATNQDIAMNEKPSDAIRKKPDSSMVKSLQLLKEKKVNAVISAGNTGALMLGASIIVKKIPGVRKVILAPKIPSKFNNFILADVGANINLKPQNYVDIAKLCTAYYESINSIKFPEIYLLNIGVEQNKGTSELVEAFQLLSQSKDINFKGNIEPRNLMDTKSDIVLCNGFVGNITLKMIEGLSKFLISQLSNSVRSIDINKLKNDFNFELSTLLLGINGIVLKCHGSSSQESFKSAINEARNLFESNITTNINKYFQK
jgi:glycerol-3-phosphate acyltransferase PlsX